MSRHTTTVSRVAAALAACAIAASAHAQTSTAVRWAANNGEDSAACGSEAAPCRSITRAIANAPAGATVRVGPGRYGDLDRDGAYDAGDEGPGTASRLGSLLIGKSIRVLSTHGAEVTTIDYGPNSSTPRAVVGIEASNVAFGDVGHGFTLVGDDTAGIRMEGQTARRNVRIIGNIVSGFHGVGVLVVGPAEGVTISDNVMARNEGFGFQVQLYRPAGATGAQNLLERNTIRDNSNAFVLRGFNVRFVGNVVDNNLFSGGQVNGGGDIVIERNFFVGNGGGALTVGGATGEPFISRFALNTLAGNAEYGIRVVGSAIRLFERNNFYGNGIGGARGAAGRPNCAVVVAAGTLTLRNNFFGSPSGPGPDPADDAGTGACGGGVQIPSFSAAPFAVDVTTDD
jgi:hypothetical protein